MEKVYMISSVFGFGFLRDGTGEKQVFETEAEARAYMAIRGISSEFFGVVDVRPSEADISRLEKQKARAEWGVYKIVNLITGRVLCDKELSPLRFKGRSEAESFIYSRSLRPEIFKAVSENPMRVVWGGMEKR